MMRAAGADREELDPRRAFGPARSLYVHIPFCASKCSYCAFNSVGRDQTAEGLVERYLEALHTEIGSLPVEAALDTIFIGGGTPSLLDARQILALGRCIRDRFELEASVEWTFEMNPGSAHDEKILAAREIGVTRLSLGAQTFSPERLRQLDREHDPVDVARSVAAIRKAGVPTWNLDLIYGIPGQGFDGFSDDLEALLALDPPHVALYNLQFEPGTALTARKEAGLVGAELDEVQLSMFELAIDRTARAGIAQYEISNFARPGHESRHNRNYWLNRSYHGVGAGAWGFSDGVRYKNVSNSERYVDALSRTGSARQEAETITRDEAIAETLLTGLRTREGIDEADFLARFDQPLGSWKPETQDMLVTEGLAERRNGALRLTRRGFMVSDAIFLEFVR